MSVLCRVITVIKFLLIFFVILSNYGIAATDSQLLKTLDIQRGLFADQYQTLDIDDQQVIYVLEENTTAIGRGVAVMIADSGTSIVGEQGFALLARELNKIGWVTILLPAPDAGFLSAAENSELASEQETAAADTTEQGIPEPLDNLANLDINKSAATTLDEQAFEQHEQQLIALLQGIVEKTQEYPGFFMVISKGTSAAWLSKIYAENKLDTPDAFVVISPFWPDRKFNQRLPTWLASTAMPVLDIYNDRDNMWAKQTVAKREVAAAKALKLQYRQRELLGFNMQQQHGTYLSKEIYGWISHMGW